MMGEVEFEMELVKLILAVLSRGRDTLGMLWVLIDA